MLCEKCGARIRENGRFCTKCGAPVEPGAEQDFVDLEAHSRGNAPGQRPRRKGPALWIITAAALAIAMAGYLIWANTGTRLADKQYARGEKYLQEQAYEQAVVAFTHSMESGNTDAAVYLRLADAYLGMHDTESAAGILYEGLAVLPEADRPMLADTLTGIGRDLLAQEKYDAVIGTLAGIADPDAEIYILLSDAYMGLGDTGRAVAILQEGMAAIPEDKEILSALAAISEGFMADKDCESVISALTGVSGPEDEDACLLLAEAYDTLGDTGAAIGILLDCRDATGSEKADTALMALLSRASGNTPGNTVNTGIVARQGDWIYYMDNADFFLHKVRTDGTGRMRLCDDQSACLNVLGDVIYYRNYSDGGALYKIHTDGSGREKIANDVCYYMTVAGGWIYYCNYSDEGKLYRMRTDGTDRTRLNDDPSYSINVTDDWIYYTDIDSIYRIRHDGTEQKRIQQCYICHKMVADGEWIYYSDGNLEYSCAIHRVRINGTGRETISEDSCEYLNIADGWIYFSNHSDGEKLYKVRTDGTGQTKLADDPCHYIGIVEDWIYYINPDDEGCYYRIHMDGTGREKVD